MQQIQSNDNDILILSAPYALKKDAIAKYRKKFIQQFRTGVITLPYGWDVKLIKASKDIEIIVEDAPLEE